MFVCVYVCLCWVCVIVNACMQVQACRSECMNVLYSIISGSCVMQLKLIFNYTTIDNPQWIFEDQSSSYSDWLNYSCQGLRYSGYLFIASMAAYSFEHINRDKGFEFTADKRYINHICIQYILSYNMINCLFHFSSIVLTLRVSIFCKYSPSYSYIQDMKCQSNSMIIDIDFMIHY